MLTVQTLPFMRKHIAQFCQDKRGVSAILIALLMPVLIGFVGLGIDAGMWYSRKREMQSAADSAAISAALTFLSNSNKNAAEEMGKSDAVRSGFDNEGGVINVSITDEGNAKVTLSEPQQMFFSAIFLPEPITITANAAAGPVSTSDSTSTFCMLALDTGMDKALEWMGSSQGQIKCGVASNSASASSLYMNGNAQLAIDGGVDGAVDLAVKGQITKLGSTTLSPRNPPVLGGGGKDPYVDLTVPTSPAACTYTNFSINQKDQTLSPGRYCGGLKLNAKSSNAKFNPGVYIIDGGEFSAEGNSQGQGSATDIKGDGVTIILTGSGNDYATLKIAGSTQIRFTAPDSGPYKGVIFYQDRNAPSFQGNNLIQNSHVGSSQAHYSGAIYFPAQELFFAGNTQLQDQETCLQVIARKITFIGNSQIQADHCNDPREGNIRPIIRETKMVRLVE